MSLQSAHVSFHFASCPLNLPTFCFVSPYVPLICPRFVSCRRLILPTFRVVLCPLILPTFRFVSPYVPSFCPLSSRFASCPRFVLPYAPSFCPRFVSSYVPSFCPRFVSCRLMSPHSAHVSFRVVLCRLLLPAFRFSSLCLRSALSTARCCSTATPWWSGPS